MATQQLNMRINTSLVEDLDFIERCLNVDKSAWLKSQIAEIVSEQKNKFIKRIHADYTEQRIDDEEYEKLMKKTPSSELQEQRKAYTECSKNYLLEVATKGLKEQLK